MIILKQFFSDENNQIKKFFNITYYFICNCLQYFCKIAHWLSRHFLSTLHSPLSELPGEINPLSVVYPASLEDYRKQTKEYVKSFSKKERENIIHIFSKGKNFFPKTLEVLDEFDVPVELQMIPVLESAFNANAVSHAGAVGYWQFMTILAKEYGLRTGGKHDERRNFAKSTVAAAKFFRDQLDYFNDDLLLCCSSIQLRAGPRTLFY